MPTTDPSEMPVLTDAAYQDVLEQLGETFNSKNNVLIQTLADTESDAKFIPHVRSGIATLDVALRIGGFPRGRITELFGPQMSGKTTIALMAIAEAQKLGGYAAFIDMEHALDFDHAKSLGVDPSRLVRSVPKDGEQAFDMVADMAESNIFDVIVVDSIASLVPRAAFEKTIGDDKALGQHARMCSQSLRKVSPLIGKSKTAVIFLNQIRMNPGVMFGNPETTPGGKSLAFYASTRVEVRTSPGKELKDGKEVVGQESSIKIKKSKTGSRAKETSFRLFFESGVDKAAALLDAGVEQEIIARGGSNYTWSSADQLIANGKEKAIQALADNPELFKQIEDELYDTLHRPSYVPEGEIQDVDVEELPEGADEGADLVDEVEETEAA